MAKRVIGRDKDAMGTLVIDVSAERVSFTARVPNNKESLRIDLDADAAIGVLNRLRRAMEDEGIILAY